MLADARDRTLDLTHPFAPTGALEEAAISSGFHKKYVRLANRLDRSGSRKPGPDRGRHPRF